MAVVYLLRADQCPALQVPAALLDPLADPTVAPVSELLANGDTSEGVEKLNRNGVRIDLSARYGGARAYSVTEGCGLAAGVGLNVVVDPGAVDIGGHLVLPDPATLAVPNNRYDAGDVTARAWLWCQQTRDLAYTTTTVPPGIPSASLGSVRTTGGAVVDVDKSGVLELRGGRLFRRTADIGPPLDTPPAGLLIETQTQDGLYLWTGEAYFRLADWGAAGFAVEKVPAGTVLVVPPYHQMDVFDGELIVEGELIVAGKVRVGP